jgi:hypothetical protein
LTAVATKTALAFFLWQLAAPAAAQGRFEMEPVIRLNRKTPGAAENWNSH